MRKIIMNVENPSPIEIVVGETVLIRFVQVPVSKVEIDDCFSEPQELANCKIVDGDRGDVKKDDQVKVTGLQEGVGTLEVTFVFGPENRVGYEFVLVVEMMEE